MGIIGASVQLYATGTTGTTSFPTALLANSLTTDEKGAFSVAGDYLCPSSASMLYVIAEGGRLASTSTANTALRFMAAIGPCGAPATTTTSIVVNEVTTVASVWSLSQFLSFGGDVSASSTNSIGLANAFNTTTNLVNLSSGKSPGAGLPPTVVVATSKLNTLADALAACVNSTAACGALFLAASTDDFVPANTLDAALNLVRNPTIGTELVFTIATLNPRFLPALSSAPPDWLLYNTITGGGLNDPAAVAIDGSGNVWVSNFFGTLSEFLPNGAPVFTSGLSGYGLNQSYGMTIDAESNVWVSNEQTTMNSGSGDIIKLSSTGESLSGGNGFSSGGIYFPLGIAADTNGNIWVADFGDSNVTLLNSNGTPLSASGFGHGFVVLPTSIAVDSGHNAWVGNQGADFITRISPDGSQVLNINCCDSATGIAVDQSNNIWAANFAGASVSLITNTSSSIPKVSIFQGGGLETPNGIAIDGVGRVWVTNYHGNSLSALNGADSSSPGKFLSANGLGSDAGLSGAYAVGIDASGNLWVSNAGSNTVTEFIGAGVPVATPLVGPPRGP